MTAVYLVVSSVASTVATKVDMMAEPTAFLTAESRVARWAELTVARLAASLEMKLVVTTAASKAEKKADRKVAGRAVLTVFLTAAC